jgi:hypothetical protein
MLSHVVMKVIQVFPSFVMLGLTCVFVRDGLPSVETLWCWVSLASLWEMVSHPSRCELTLVRIDVVVWAMLEWWRRFGFYQVMWLVMLESAKDWILGVDPPGQQVPPRVWYEMACSQIRYAIGCESCSVEWGWLLSVWPIFVAFFVNCMNHMVQKGPLCAGNLSTASRATLCGNP